MRVNRVKLMAESARRGIRTAELASKAGVSRATLSAMRGGKSCSVETVQRVAQALGVPVESLLEDSGKGC